MKNVSEEVRAREAQQRYLELHRSMFKTARLDSDTCNDWAKGIAGVDEPGWLDVLNPKQHYAERAIAHGGDSEMTKLTLQLSDPEAVAEYDQIVDEFNADLERIRREMDQETVKKFWKKATDLIYSKRKI